MAKTWKVLKIEFTLKLFIQGDLALDIDPDALLAIGTEGFHFGRVCSCSGLPRGR